MLLYNVVTAMPGDNEKEDTIYEMQQYLLAHNIEIVYDDVEVEEETGIQIDAIKPFNPSKIDIMDYDFKRIYCR